MSAQGTPPYVFEPLPWDTAYFSVPSARLTLLEPLNEEQWSEALALTDGFAFVCIRNRNCDVKNAMSISRSTDAFVTDTNVQFQKKVCPNGNRPLDPLLTVCDRLPPNADILAIAATAFKVSRFLADEALKARNGALVYHEWVKNAFGKPGRFFLVSQAADAKEPTVNGFLLFSIENSCLTLELIGVSDAYQRRGVGARMWQALESEAASRNCTSINVGTQLNNLNALRFYTKVGCSLWETTQIYHWWKRSADRYECVGAESGER